MVDWQTLASYFWDVHYLNLFIITLVLTLAGLIIWFMYTRLAKRDLFHVPEPKDGETRWQIFWEKFIYGFKYMILFPLYSFVWFLVFSAVLLLLTKTDKVENAFYFGIILVSAIRVSAYINERMAEDIAKLLPLTLIATIIINPAFLSLDAQAIVSVFSLSEFSKLYTVLPYFIKYLLFTIVLEWVLRGSHGIYRHFRPKQEEKKKK